MLKFFQHMSVSNIISQNITAYVIKSCHFFRINIFDDRPAQLRFIFQSEFWVKIFGLQLCPAIRQNCLKDCYQAIIYTSFFLIFQGPTDHKSGAASVPVRTSQTPAYYPYEYTFEQYPYDRYGYGYMSTATAFKWNPIFVFKTFSDKHFCCVLLLTS